MKVAVFGLGYVGTVTAACLAANGHEVCGIDVDQDKVRMISAGKSPVVEPGLDDLVAAGRRTGRLNASTSVSAVGEDFEISLICVGTPSNSHGGTNLDYVYRVVDDLASAVAERSHDSSRFHVVVVRSTVPPGTVAQIRASLRASLAERGSEVGVAMCPEFLREGSGISDFYAPPYMVIGADEPRVAERVKCLFEFIDRPVHVVDTRTAEALKYASNAFHAIKISFANELGRLFQRYGVDSRKVMELFCKDDQLNISCAYLRPGFAFGGSCLPKDLRALLQLARIESIDLPMLSGVLTSNHVAVSEVVDKVLDCDGRTVALLGLSFKMNSDDLRESPYVELAETLLGKGYLLRIYDPIAHPGRLIGANRQHVDSRLPHLRSMLAADPADALQGADIAIVSVPSQEVIKSILANPPAQIIDLDGRLGIDVERLDGYEGACW